LLGAWGGFGDLKAEKMWKNHLFFCVCVTFEEQEIYEDSMNSTLCLNQAKW
jgi:uncharacterized protein YjaG (DUF416 family)